MNAQERLELNPFTPEHYVLCSFMIIAGYQLKFGDQVPECCDLHHLHHHYANGVIGTKEELATLSRPLKLSYDDPASPVANFIGNPDEPEDQVQEELDREIFALENAKLLKTKDDLIGYAALFDIHLKKATNISIKMMHETLKVEATEKGLI